MQKISAGKFHVDPSLSGLSIRSPRPRAAKRPLGNVTPDRLGDGDVYDQLEFGWLLDWQIPGLAPFRMRST